MGAALRNVLVFGSTGLVGAALLDALLADTSIAGVVAVTRRPLPQKNPKLRNVVTDFGGGFTAAAIGEINTIDAAFCCLGTTIKQAGSKQAFHAIDHDLVLRCAQVSRDLGTQHFLVVSAMGAGDSSLVYYNKVKGEMERDVAALSFPRLSIFQPSLLLGERGGPFRPGEAIAIKLSPLFSPLMMGSAYTPIAARDVATGMLACALSPMSKPVERLRWREIMALGAARRS